jgi:hypothetical protein
MQIVIGNWFASPLVRPYYVQDVPLMFRRSTQVPSTNAQYFWGRVMLRISDKQIRHLQAHRSNDCVNGASTKAMK